MKRSTLLVFFSFLLTAAAQQPKKAPAPPATTARVEGVAIDSSTQRPVPGVTVSALQGNDARTAVTDAQGRFTFGVRHGTVRLLTRIDGYAQNRDGILVTVSPGQQVRGITLRMIAGSGVSGSIYDARRKPVQYAHAVLARYSYDDDGKRRLRPAGNSDGGATNEQGEFHIVNAEPGEYVLQIDPPTLGEREPGEVFVTGYYPGTAVASQAQLITLKSGSETRVDDLTLPSVRGGTIRVRLNNQTGGRIDNTMSKYVRWNAAGNEPQTAVVPLLFMGGAERADIPVPSGTYEITAGWVRSTAGALPPIGLGRTRVDAGRGNVDAEIIVKKGVRVAGRAVQESKAGQKPVTGIRCELRSDEWAAVNAVSGADGLLTIENTQPATYRVNCVALPPDTYLARVMQGDRDVLKNGLEVQSETNFTVVIASDGGTVEGFVTDDKEKVADALVVLVPDLPAGEGIHLYRTVQTDQLGGFTFRAVAPGAYRLYSWPSLNGAAYKNEEFMKKYEGKGTAVKLMPGGKATAALKLLENLDD